MGILLSRLKSPEPVAINVAGSISEDPRSPTQGIMRTPLIVEKRKPYLETDLDQLTPTLPLRVKLLRKSADPRSPTDGINRTPIALLQTGSNFESPVSLYSNYQTDTISESCLPSPCEPSVNVSDFESEFARELDSLVEQLDKSMTETPKAEDIKPIDSPKPVLSFKDDSTKQICKDLVNEIIESFKEFEEETKNAKSEKKKLKLVAPAAVSDCQTQIRKRKPLSNITSSAGNTPTKKYNSLRKERKLVKVDLAGENSPHTMPSVKVRTQWDHDSTVII